MSATVESGPIRVCFVCTGNICRSPIAERVLVRMLEEAGLSDEVAVDSVGTGSWHVGHPMDPRAAASLRAAGYDADRHVARQVDRELLAERDLVVALDRSHAATLSRMAPGMASSGKLVLLRSLSEEPEDSLDVDDPYYGDDSGFDDVVAVVERSCRSLVKHLDSMVKRRRGPAR